MSRAEADAWGRQVAEQLRALGPTELFAHAGRDYVRPLQAAGVKVECPLDGLGIGRRLQWYVEHGRG